MGISAIYLESILVRHCQAMGEKRMLLRKLGYRLQYADSEESETFQTSFSDPKLSQGRAEADLSYLLGAMLYIFGVSFPSRKEQFIGKELTKKYGFPLREIKISSLGIGLSLCGTKPWPLVSAAVRGEANILCGIDRRLDRERVGARLSTSSLESQNICKPAPTGALKNPFRENLLRIPARIKN